jgi:hypothetical protein
MTTAQDTERVRWQWGFLTGDAVERAIAGGEVAEPELVTGRYSLTRAEAGEVAEGYFRTLDEIQAAGHQVDEGMYIGGYSSETVAKAISELVNLTPTGLFHLTMRGMADA